jgi:hypothetical protein
MKRLRFAITPVGLTLMALVGTFNVQVARAQGFNPGCPLPFDAIKQPHAIDDFCSAEGTGSSDANAAQNRAKNNFCASGPPVLVDRDAFVRLQQAAQDQGVTFGGFDSLPKDRSVLQNLLQMAPGVQIGEGTLVRYVAFVIDAHHSNVSGGESVNCKQPGEENNDIHIELGRSTAEDPCDSITAEMSPHFRPSAWDAVGEANIDQHPVRITGQLFFDASHKPCTAAKRASPPRASIWEVHPVYAIDICKQTTLDACSAGDDSIWVSLDQWHSIEQEAGDGTSPSSGELTPAALALSAKAPAGLAPATGCDASLWDHVYHPQRLRVLSKCISVTGVIRHIKQEADGDYHIQVRLDPQFAKLTNARNLSAQAASLVVEPVCQTQVTQADAQEACRDFHSPVRVPGEGTHVRIKGSYVLDAEPGHGWMEIHPVTSIDVIQ